MAARRAGEAARKMLPTKPQTASRRKANAECFWCFQVWMVELAISWARQPASVRLPPNTLRLTIGARSASFG